MAHYRTTVNSPAGADTAYDYLADFASVAQWDPTVSSASLISGEPGALGARYRVVIGRAPLSWTLDYEIVAAERPAGAAAPGGGRVALRARNRDVESYDVITFTPRPDGGTDVSYDARLTGNGPRALFDPGFWLAMQVIGRRARSGLAAAVAALPKPAAS